MKTSIAIADSLLQAKRVAKSRNTTVCLLVEEGLRSVLKAPRSTQTPFALRRASFKGRGLQAELADATWERIGDLAYEGRGGNPR